MKKSRIILFVTMLLLVASTCTVLGGTITDEGHWYYKTYSQTYTGTNTSFAVGGTLGQSYTIITNKTNTVCHMDAMVIEYEITGEQLNQVYNVGSKPPEDVIHSGYLNRSSRNTALIYVHKAKCYLSPYQMYQTVDVYEYTAYQDR